MERAVPVEIVRPHRKARDWIGVLIGNWLALLATSALIMLLLGACHSEIDSRIPALGYPPTLLALVTLRAIVTTVSAWDTYKLWSRERGSS